MYSLAISNASSLDKNGFSNTEIMQIYALAKPIIPANSLENSIIIIAYICMTFIKYDKYPGKLGLEHSPVGLWNFDGNLNDSSGNDFTLSGTPLGYSIQTNDFQYGVIFGTSLFSRASRDELLAIPGALTIEVLGTFRTPAGVSEYICSIGNSGESEADNINYSLYFSSLKLGILWEYGSGNNITVEVGNIIPIGIPCFIAVTRSASNPAVVNFYINGNPVGFGSDTACTGGTASTCCFRIGSNSLSTELLYVGSVISSLKIIPSELSPSQIKEEYKRTFYDTTHFFRKK